MTYVTYLDIETTFENSEKGKVVNSPFFEHKLVSIGLIEEDDGPDGLYKKSYMFFYHNDIEPDPDCFFKLQDILTRSDIVVGHNLKFDIQWLRECGFKYNKCLFDTMVAEYILLKGMKKGLSLNECCKRRDIGRKNSEILEKYIKDGLSFEAIPHLIVKEYGENDVRITQQLAKKQLEQFGVAWSDLAQSGVI